jgi:hypothetical protein
MQNNDQRPRVSLEDLLRLKRAEKPPADFWKGFEQELRQKQLAALLEKRPWWQEAPRWAARHVYLPMGAAAALAFAFVTLRNEENSPQALGETAPPSLERTVAAVPASEPAPTEAPVAAVTEPMVETETAATVGAVIAATLPNDVGQMTPWSAPPTIDTPSSRSIAENLARLEETEPELLEPMRSNRLVSAAARPALIADQAPVELASVSVDPNGRRSNRLLVGYEQRDFTPEPAAPEQVRQRIARRLADPDLLDQVRRLDVKGDRLSLKL